MCPFSFLRQRPCACEGKRDFSLSLYRRAFVRIPAHIYAASSYVATSERGTSGREIRGEKEKEGEGKCGGGRGTPCFDPRKRRRQSRRVLGSIPQGGRHSAALKPSASSFPPSLLPSHPTHPFAFPSDSSPTPVGAPLGTPLPSFYREPPTALLQHSRSLCFALSRSIRLAPLLYLAPLSPFLPPSVAILSLLAFSTSLSSLSRGTHPRSRSAKLRLPEDRRGWLEDFFVTTGRCCAS